MSPALLLLAVVTAAPPPPPISFAEAAAWLMPPTLITVVATEHGVGSGRARELNPLLDTRGKRLAATALTVTVEALVVHKVSQRNRKAGKWVLGVFVGYKWIEAGWDVHVVLSR